MRKRIPRKPSRLPCFTQGLPEVLCRLGLISWRRIVLLHASMKLSQSVKQRLVHPKTCLKKFQAFGAFRPRGGFESIVYLVGTLGIEFRQNLPMAGQPPVKLFRADVQP